MSKKQSKNNFLGVLSNTLKRTLKTSAEKFANYTREVGRLYTLSWPCILALCKRLKLRYVEFMLFQYVRSPNIMLPIRINVLPCSMAMG